MSSKAAALIQSTRPPFLVLAPICVLLGISISIYLNSEINTNHAVAVLIGAICAHISVNTFNEYFDYASGLDLMTIRTPFSGGSGSIPEFPDAHQSVLVLAMCSLIVTAIIGLYLVSQTSWLLLALGLLGVVIIVAYTRWINRFPWLCLFAPGLAFGPLFIVGTYISVSPEESVDAAGLLTTLLVSLVPFFLVNNLLLLNQFPDLEPDKHVGRKTFPIVYGLNKSLAVYLIFVILTMLSVILAVFIGAIPMLGLLAILPLVLGLHIHKGVKTSGFKIDEMIPYMGMNVVLTLLTIVAFAVLILISIVF